MKNVRQLASGLLALFTPLADAWGPRTGITLPRPKRTGVIVQARCAIKIRAMSTAAVIVLMLALDQPAEALDFTFTGDYADPFHPRCERHIDVSADGTSFVYRGTAVGAKADASLPPKLGCSPEEVALYGLRQGSFPGTVQRGKISAGDGVHEGRWERDGIRWADGNKWTKLTPSGDLAPTDDPATAAGKYFFYAYVAVSVAAGAKEIASRLAKIAQGSEP